MEQWHFDIQMIGRLDAEKIRWIDKGIFEILPRQAEEYAVSGETVMRMLHATSVLH